MLVCKQNPFRAYFKRYRLLVLAIAFLSLFIFGCEENKLAQCGQIFQVARDVRTSNQNVSYINDQASFEMKSWLRAANKFNQAAEHLTALKINQRELINYQNQLATIYRIYSQATYDAVRARENQDFSALQLARSDAQKAGQLQEKLIQQINAYCLAK